MKLNNNYQTPYSNSSANNQKSNVQFAGLKEFSTEAQKKVKGIANDLFEPNRLGGMGRELFVGTAFTFLLAGRLYTSRDSNERRETLTRDLPTFITAVFGVPWVEKYLTKKLEENSGFVVSVKKKDSKNNAIKEIVEYSQLDDWYKFDKTLKGGLKSFAERLSGLGANVKKVFLSLNVDNETLNKITSKNNAEFITEVVKNNELSAKITEALKDADNLALKNAKMLKTKTKGVGILSTLATIGLLIPELNIVVTKMVNRNKPIDEKQNTEKAEVKVPYKAQIDKFSNIDKTSLKGDFNKAHISNKFMFNFKEMLEKAQ